MERYYDLDARPITQERYFEIMSLKQSARGSAENGESQPKDDPTRIGSDHVGEAWVSTVWLGLDHAFGSGPPIIFETMIFGGEHDMWCFRYPTKQAALAGHDRVIAALRAGTDLPWD